MKWLLSELLPQIRKRLPELRLILAGRQAARSWGAWVGSDEGIEVHSDVPDIRPLMQRATAAIVPLRQGSGTRFKILEAMSMELPVISTSLGAEGLNVQHGQNLLLADSVEDICRCRRGHLRRFRVEAGAQRGWSKISVREIRLGGD